MDIELLFFFIVFPFTPRHIAGRNDQGSVCRLVNEKDDQVSSRLGPSQSSIDILTFTVTLFDEPKLGFALKQLPDFTLSNTVFAFELVYDVIKPDDSVNVQFASGLAPPVRLEAY